MTNVTKTWAKEDRYCAAVGAIDVPLVGDGHPLGDRTTVRVPFGAVLGRTFRFTQGGVYVMWEQDRAVYVGATVHPLGVRLRNAMASIRSQRPQPWTDGCTDAWTVSMIYEPNELAATAIRYRLVLAHKPKYNRQGERQIPASVVATASDPTLALILLAHVPPHPTMLPVTAPPNMDELLAQSAVTR